MAKPPEKDSSAGPLQVVAHNLARWVLMLSAGMGSLGIAAFYFGLLVVGSMLISIFLVAVTLYFFLRLWPEDPRPQPVARVAKTGVPRRPAMVAAVRIDGPPKVRAVMALREMVRRQESFQISQQGAEAFARTIRYMLRSQK